MSSTVSALVGSRDVDATGAPSHRRPRRRPSSWKLQELNDTHFVALEPQEEASLAKPTEHGDDIRRHHGLSWRIRCERPSVTATRLDQRLDQDVWILTSPARSGR